MLRRLYFQLHFLVQLVDVVADIQNIKKRQVPDIVQSCLQLDRQSYRQLMEAAQVSESDPPL